MGKRSRKRADGPVRVVATAERSKGPGPLERRPKGRIDRVIERADARPKPPWHPVPLVELSVLAGIVLIVVGLINAEDRQGRLAVVFGVVLASLAGLDTAVRDHFAGFRSHSSLLGAMPAVILVLVLAMLKVAPSVLLPVAVVTFAAGFFALRTQFKRKTGVGFKV